MPRTTGSETFSSSTRARLVNGSAAVVAIDRVRQAKAKAKARKENIKNLDHGFSTGSNWRPPQQRRRRRDCLCQENSHDQGKARRLQGHKPRVAAGCRAQGTHSISLSQIFCHLHVFIIFAILRFSYYFILLDQDVVSSTGINPALIEDVQVGNVLPNGGGIICASTETYCL